MGRLDQVAGSDCGGAKYSRRTPADRLSWSLSHKPLQKKFRSVLGLQGPAVNSGPRPPQSAASFEGRSQGFAHPDQIGNGPSHGVGLMRPCPVSPVSISGASWCAPARAMHPANCPACDRRGLAGMPGPFAVGAASAGICKALAGVHGVDTVFHASPPPPVATAPTIACPPALTVTCSTITRCCPPVR